MKKSIFHISWLLFITTFFSSCSNQKLEQYTFINESITVDIPTYFILKDNESIEKFEEERINDTKYSVLISSFYDLKRGDQALDIFKDKNSKFHYLFFLNTQGGPVFNEKIFNKLKNAQTYQYDLIMDADATIQIEMIDSKFETIEEQSLVKMKHKFTLIDEEEVFYKTVFFLNTSGKTIVAHELNNSEEDSESIIRSVRIPE